MRYLLTIPILVAMFFSSIFRNNELPEDTQMCHAIVKIVALKLKEKYGLRAGSIRERGKTGIYEFIGISFQINETLSKEEGRKLLLISVKELLDTINSTQEFKQYMSVYPFTEENVEIAIFAMGEDKRGVVYPNILIFEAYNGSVKYKTKLRDTYGYHTREEETFTEAQRIVNLH